MTLQKFNIPVEIIDMISTLEPENQGVIYSHLFAYIYHGTPVPDDIDPRCRLILRMIVERVEARVRRARASHARAMERKAAAAAPVRSGEPEADVVGRRIIDNVEKSHRPLGTMAQALYEARLRKTRHIVPAVSSAGVGDGRGQKSRAMI